jgi:hypothetical protein
VGVDLVVSDFLPFVLDLSPSVVRQSSQLDLAMVCFLQQISRRIKVICCYVK